MLQKGSGLVLGWPEGGYPAPQGPFYCGVGTNSVFGRPLAEAHMEACLQAGLTISGINAEVRVWERSVCLGECVGEGRRGGSVFVRGEGIGKCSWVTGCCVCVRERERVCERGWMRCALIRHDVI